METKGDIQSIKVVLWARLKDLQCDVWEQTGSFLEQCKNNGAAQFVCVCCLCVCISSSKHTLMSNELRQLLTRQCINNGEISLFLLEWLFISAPHYWQCQSASKISSPVMMMTHHSLDFKMALQSVGVDCFTLQIFIKLNTVNFSFYIPGSIFCTFLHKTVQLFHLNIFILLYSFFYLCFLTCSTCFHLSWYFHSDQNWQWVRRHTDTQIWDSLKYSRTQLDQIKLI